MLSVKHEDHSTREDHQILCSVPPSSSTSDGALKICDMEQGNNWEDAL